ncbi:MAG TPA: hypothetical protein VG319_04675 [Polyangia bacterium]|jgi:hypothetical protein|nr:hypothetical protein [Polyangia bacterium]
MGFARLILRVTLASALALAAISVVPAGARAQPLRRLAQVDTAARAALVSERQRVRKELERANAEIGALKRSGRGLREDYRLRERLADAEALARRLTELDARLGAGAAPTSRGPGAEPRMSPSDGPAELEAKADILADQAQRLAARGDALLGRARDLRARQTLRRRVGQMERDPFSPLEGSKRRAMTGSVTSGLTSGPSPSPRPGGSPPVSVADRGVGGTPNTGSANPLTPETAAGTAGPSQSAPGVSTAASPPNGAGAGAATTPLGAGAAVSSPASPSSAPTPTTGAAADGAALSVQLRELLDPTTLAELQHLESAAGSGASLEALERAGAALKARADRLSQQAAALRASEHVSPRNR